MSHTHHAHQNKVTTWTGHTAHRNPANRECLASTTQHQTTVSTTRYATDQPTAPPPPKIGGSDPGTRVTAAIATGKHPDPSRTRKLSLPAPMVLPPRGGGRVGRRRTSFSKGPPAMVALSSFQGSSIRSGIRSASTGGAPDTFVHRGLSGSASSSARHASVVPRRRWSR